MVHQTQHLAPIGQQFIRWTGYLGSFGLAAVAVCALMMNVVLNASFHAAYLAVVLVPLILLHLMRFPKVLFSREFALYAVFLVYMVIELLWTEDWELATNTLLPAFNFVLILILFSALITYHNIRSVLAGMCVGFLAGAVFHTNFSGFPFAYPANFSYNAIALMYLFGLFIVLLSACYYNMKNVFLIVSLIILGHIVATTSIKANLGILLGATVAAFMHFRQFATLVRRNLMLLATAFSGLAYMLLSNEVLMGILQRGVSRVGLGIKVLQARGDVPGYSAMDSREIWRADGLDGWAQSPVFGHGVESFRSDFGITSHSTPIDLLYNSGLIGLALFYAVFVSIAWRLLDRTEASLGNRRLLIISITICFVFITLSGTMHYSSFLAAVLGISVAILRLHSRPALILTSDPQESRS